MHKLPYYSNLAAAKAGIQAIRYMKGREFSFKPIQEFIAEDLSKAA
jgi:hypothetical protein